MPFPPVIVRELREESHRPATVRIRAGAAAASLFVLTMLWALEGVDEGDGDDAFGALNVVFCVSVWLMVPFMTADCISREKREGTLGLLFLTPLTPTQIIFGKTVCHALRAFGLLLAVLPPMLICFMLGGIGWQIAAIALVMNSACIIMALSAGFLASSYCQRWNRAVVATTLVGLTFLLLYSWNLNAAMEWHSPRKVRWDFGNLIENLFKMGFGGNRAWSRLPGRGIGGVQIIRICAQCFCFALALSAAALWLARRQIGKTRCAEPPSRRQKAIQRTFWKPRYARGLFRRRMNRKLDRNPIGWLQRYSTGSRLVSGSWALGIIALESWIFSHHIYDVPDWSIMLALLMLVSFVFVAAGSFTAERQSGALELILVTPLSVGQIIRGRLLGILGQLALPAALLIGSYFFFRTFHLNSYWHSSQPLIRNPVPVFIYFLFPWGMVTLSVIGLFFSLRQKGFLSALLATLAIGAFLPLAALGLYEAMMWKLRFHFLRIHELLEAFLQNTGLDRLIHEDAAFIALIAFAQLPIAIWALFSLNRKLRDRRFIMTSS